MTNLISASDIEVAITNSGLRPAMAGIGDTEIVQKISIQDFGDFKSALSRSDFERMIDREMILIERIKRVIIEMIHYSDELPMTKYSDFISKKLGINYTYLSKLFSKVKRITIEHFIIAHKIEKVKQLLAFNEMTLSEIAWKLHYSSTAHLSAQFKKVTGLTPSLFKKSTFKKILPPENL